MISIDRHIEYLLIGHDCVIVPGLGAFIARYQAAVVTPLSMTPPQRVVAFNPDITHNDGLLATSIARQSGLGYDVACRHLEEQVQQMRRIIAADGAFTINRVGTLTAEGDAMLFTPDERPIVALPYFGLPELELEPAKVEEPAAAAIEEPHGRVLTVRLPVSIVRVAASIALLVGLGLVCTTPRTADSADNAYASLQGPEIKFARMEAAAPDAQKPVMVLAAPGADGIVMVDTTATASSKKQKVSSNESGKSQILSDFSGEWAIVVASLPNEKRAKKYIAAQGNPSLRILNQDGRYRVYVTTAPTEDAAKALAWSRDMQRRYPGAWVTRK